jgi:murein L,D-transpeptidase YcbB/YkuD
VKRTTRAGVFATLVAATTVATVVAIQPPANANHLLPCGSYYNYEGAWVPVALPFGPPIVNCDLRRGDLGEGVETLQNTLNICYTEFLTVDGRFGPLTEAALMRAQSIAGTTPDGIYGPNTRRAIEHQRTDDGRLCKRVP